MADANYYNRALWKIVEHEEGILIESVITGRYLFDSAPDDHVGNKRGQDGGWINEEVSEFNKMIANFLDQLEGGVLLESVVSGRYLFDSTPGIASDGAHVADKRCQDGGWGHEGIKPAVMADANYHNKALWKIVQHEACVLIESVETGRYLFDSAPDGYVGDIRCQDGGWIHENIKPALMADANYYNRA
eukprot:CAMPEP_0169301698 /NCGR_PEP_ID=MMETSP1016-20121227/68401_1 /TAXON_ID=342587 /ORGANISM="Karlodinium micrum, Strain CCMP2283" /LENGTH=188 /DNA_ID=CAMNT_0009394351 /DNA_START=1 /DNA_END=564 /DNA_ORIENTATION=-